MRRSGRSWPRGYRSTRRTKLDVWIPVFLIKFTNKGLGGKGVRIDQYAATLALAACRQRCKNRYLLNDWVIVPVGDKPECESHKT